MVRILVIADDLSGAAEIAGIGLRFGLSTRLCRRVVEHIDPGLTVVDTDSRSLTPANAAQAVRAAVAKLQCSNFDFIYKKTDSAFRGPILAEVKALVAATGASGALLL